MLVRLLGLASLVVCAFALHELLTLVHSATANSATGVELLLGLVVVITGLGGVFMASAGSELLRSSKDR
jgi:hypothetical protein